MKEAHVSELLKNSIIKRKCVFIPYTQHTVEMRSLWVSLIFKIRAQLNIGCH